MQPICTLLHRGVNLHFQFSITAPDTKKAPLSRCFQLVEKAIFDFYASCGSTHSIEFALQIHKFREHGPGHPLLPLCGNSPCVSRNLYKGRKMCPQDAFFLRDSLESVVSSERLFGKRSFSTASGTMSFSLCLLGLCNFCLADNHTDQRIKFIIVRGWLSGGSIPALSITLSIHAILRPSFSMTSTPSISCTASPLSAPCTAFQ